MPNQQPQWGPHHQQGLPGGIQMGKGGGYWWGITTGCWLAALSLLGNGYRGSQSAAILLVIMVCAAAAVGAGESRHGKAFASRRWVLFTSATIASSTAYFLPALAYVAGYYGYRQYAASGQTQNRAMPGTPPQTPEKRSAAPGLPLVAQRYTQPPQQATGAPVHVSQPVGVPVVSGGYFGIDATGGTVAASARGAALVIGPPESGKTQNVIMPSVAYAPAAVVSTSMKAEVLAATHVARSLRGKCWLFDPGGATVPAGVIGLRWNPLCDVTDWDAARSVAARLTGPSRAGAGASHAGDHWTDRAETWLAVLLYAARLSAPDGDIEALARWCMNPTAAGPECEAVLIVAEQDGEDGANIAASLLDSLLSIPDRERESIASTLGRIMNIYTSSAALRSGVNPNFDVHAFVRSNDTVYITAPVDRQRDYAPLIAGFLESIRLAQYHRRQNVDMGTENQSAPVTFVLDEAANTAPIPLPNVVSEAGGQGLHLVVAFQDLSQARARWGQAAEGFLTLFPEKLILPGMNDKATADMLSKMSGEYDRMSIGVNQPGRTFGHSGATHFNASSSQPGYSYHTTRTPVLSIADITGIPAGHGLHWSPRGWDLITLNPWWQQRQHLGL
ncbi:Type IV secretory pathway VirD4 components-like protein [Mycobacteroides abscessus subsp. abscessus]|uniref:type IV secretory system conjugative DNA transfer family protein n=1 Tax=Mycobacteroides abscessus TaxID=36809 RepID=UPI00092969CA|nr:type IV secretory system conjugative DNA transfer family protein [Mycobacteroides abscessus]SHQ67511.1 Type IV secretory pathway VirD4 components-like protein [Mycobacteroides abscessus subsp. abscessus]SHR91081.1 Type IV secretory pathway VirD4 components-like protein [Mycobacteroides abscessus subsp. abscessus]SIH64260.1 Type IV secretory pathway VirD4 components-like protein [Mycobacteroides abscessus subsp. abscessus]